MSKPKLTAELAGRTFTVEEPQGWRIGKGWMDDDAELIAALDKAIGSEEGVTFDLEGPFINGVWAITVKYSDRTDAELSTAIVDAMTGILRRYKKAA